MSEALKVELEAEAEATAAVGKDGVAIAGAMVAGAEKSFFFFAAMDGFVWRCNWAFSKANFTGVSVSIAVVLQH